MSDNPERIVITVDGSFLVCLMNEWNLTKQVSIWSGYAASAKIGCWVKSGRRLSYLLTTQAFQEGKRYTLATQGGWRKSVSLPGRQTSTNYVQSRESLVHLCSKFFYEKYVYFQGKVDDAEKVNAGGTSAGCHFSRSFKIAKYRSIHSGSRELSLPFAQQKVYCSTCYYYYAAASRFMKINVESLGERFLLPSDPVWCNRGTLTFLKWGPREFLGKKRTEKDHHHTYRHSVRCRL